jgi:hypothetical protein
MIFSILVIVNLLTKEFGIYRLFSVHAVIAITETYIVSSSPPVICLQQVHSLFQNDSST